MAKIRTRDKLQEVLAKFPNGLSSKALLLELNKIYSVTKDTAAVALSQMVKNNQAVASISYCEHCGTKIFIYKKGHVNVN